MARNVWKGSISFGLVNIPVSLVAATSQEDLRFRLLDRRDFTPVRLKRVNEQTGEEVPWGEIVKGYEHSKGDFVVLTDADFRRANVEATQTVEIVDFVDRLDVEPMYYETPYYLEPIKKGRKGYALLRETLRRMDKVGIAKVVIRSKEHLAMVVPHEDVLVVELLRFAVELRDPNDLDLPGSDLEKEGISKKEIDLAQQLVDGMASEWKPEKYRDDYREDVLALVEKKVAAGEGRTIDESEPEREEPKTSNVIDLMPLLERSLAAKAKAKSSALQKPKPRVASRKTRTKKSA